VRIVVLGATGSLGRAVVDEAKARGHDVVGTSRKGAVKVDLTTGEGLAEALRGTAVVIDAVNDSSKGAHALLVDGTKRVLAAAKEARVGHYVGISIVGIDDAPFPYYRVKCEQEKVIEGAGVPWTLLRATQFHDLVPRMASSVFVAAPMGWSWQPIDVRDVATMLVDAAASAPAKRLPDAAGPEVIPYADLVRRWAKAAGATRIVVPVPVPGAYGAYLRSGKMCSPDRAVGKRTYDAWLDEVAKARATA